ncbi:nucleotidyltransferase family protein [Pseudomonas sp. GD03842]|uniref:nucleotidyltransferase family protein n=1 Tax=unclassified Pseudomonas TaxID=196821 RepID=UPI000D386759|nr:MULTISPECIES: nucleotidyltransferase family protein [unclassified Pseudomonas]MDH0748117.1 nucleotidyltransferase family protein [Pseudomonas sp. GD03842]RAU47393.1 nucleotidyltransferase family protein [Pseudomonas sp. RIT 409]RAU51932.1 nucleotidyltransferase family protein [Pseudomonas sp. RIT 412]
MRETLCAIVLAAGQGARFRQVAGAHRNKLLAQCMGRDGVERAVLEHVLENLRTVVDKTVLLTRPEYTSVAELGLRHGCEVVVLDSPGMGDSIAAAVAAEPDHRGWLIVLGDMPFIQVETLECVAQSLTADLISVPVHGGQYGHPVGFGRSFGPALRGLAGEKGARRLFQGVEVNQLLVDDPGVLWDVDVPAALVFK